MTPTPIIPKADEVLLPCHRCGGPVRLDNYQRSDDFCPTIHCACGLSFRLTDNYCEADTAKTVAAWNTRAPSPAVGGEVIEVTADMVRAASESRARDDEGEFPPLCDLIGFSGENKTRTVIRAALVAALEAFVRGRGR